MNRKSLVEDYMSDIVAIDYIVELEYNDIDNKYKTDNKRGSVLRYFADIAGLNFTDEEIEDSANKNVCFKKCLDVNRVLKEILDLIEKQIPDKSKVGKREEYVAKFLVNKLGIDTVPRICCKFLDFSGLYNRSKKLIANMEIASSEISFVGIEEDYNENKVKHKTNIKKFDRGINKDLKSLPDKLIVFHGSPVLVEKPAIKYCKPFNDYGRGFYTTEDIKESRIWAVGQDINGHNNQYSLDIKGLNVLTLKEENIKEWIAILANYRIVEGVLEDHTIEIRKRFVEKYYTRRLEFVDVIIGYRIDRNWTTMSQEFFRNEIPLEMMIKAMHLMQLGMQIVLKSPKAFNNLIYIGSEVCEKREYLPIDRERAKKAYADYNKLKSEYVGKKGTYVNDLIRK